MPIMCWGWHRRGEKSNALLETGHRHLSRDIKQFINWCENSHTCTNTHTLSHLSTNTHSNVVGIPWTRCLLTHYLGSKSQRLEGDGTRRVIICRGKLQPSVKIVLQQTWQNRGLIRFTKRKDLFSRHHHVRVFEILWVLFFKSKLEGNESELQLWSKPQGIEGIHMTTAHFHTITATVMGIIGWIGPLISPMHPLFHPKN